MLIGGDTMRQCASYIEMAYLQNDLVNDLKEAKSRPVENQNPEYIDRLTKTIAELERLRVYY